MGVQIQGDTGNVIATKGTYSGNVTIGGTLTYEDVTNVDSIGLVTARNGIEVGASPGVAASISVDGNAIFSGITTIGGNVKVGTGITLSPDGDVFFTGIITGNGSGLSNVGVDTAVVFTDKLQVGDSPELISVGVSSDFQISHNGGTGNTNIKQVTGDMYFYTGSDLNLHLKDGTSTDLFYANSKKLETTSSGVTVTGAVSATSFSGIGAITMVDSWGLSSSQAYSDGDFAQYHWTRKTGTHGGNIGNAMTESSGVFTFPQTGLYYLSMQLGIYASGGTLAYAGFELHLSTNGGSSYSNVSDYYTSSQNSQYARIIAQELLDVTDASNFKIKLKLSMGNGLTLQGGQGRTSLIFIRYGDT